MFFLSELAKAENTATDFPVAVFSFRTCKSSKYSYRFSSRSFFFQNLQKLKIRSFFFQNLQKLKIQLQIFQSQFFLSELAKAQNTATDFPVAVFSFRTCKSSKYSYRFSSRSFFFQNLQKLKIQLQIFQSPWVHDILMQAQWFSIHLLGVCWPLSNKQVQ